MNRATITTALMTAAETEENALEPRRRADQMESVPADVETGSYRREDARTAEMLGRPIGEKRRKDRQRYLDARIADPTAQVQHQPANANAPHQFAGDNGGEHRRRLAQRKHPGADRGHGKAIKHQRRGIIRQAFAFEYDEDAPGQLHPARDRKRRNGVGRRNDRAQHESDRPGKAQHPMRRRSGGDRRERHASESEQRDRPQIKPKLPPTHRHGR